MRAVVFGSDPSCVEAIGSGIGRYLQFPTHRVVRLLSGFHGVKSADADVSLISSISATMMNLTMAKSIEEGMGRSSHLMIAVDMPLLLQVGSEYSSMPRVLMPDGISDDVASACSKMLRSVYASVGFDYVFKVGDFPTREMLESNMAVLPGQPIIPVSDAEQVADLLNMEARHGV